MTMAIHSFSHLCYEDKKYAILSNFLQRAHSQKQNPITTPSGTRYSAELTEAMQIASS